MATTFFEDGQESRRDRQQSAAKQWQAGAERAVADADQRNGARLRTDPMLARLMAAYDKCDENNRAELVRIAEVACSMPGGIV